MARIVINTWGTLGDLNPYLGLGRALRERGHDVCLALPTHYRDFAERAGLAFAKVGYSVDLDAPETQAQIERILNDRFGTQKIFEELVMEHLRDSFRELRAACEGADMLISHTLSLSAPIVSELTGIRWVSTVLSPISFGSGFEMAVPPPAPWLKGLEKLGPGVGHFFARFMRRISLRWTAPVAQLRRELGLPPGAHPIFEGQLRAPLVLAMFSRVLGAPQPDWPPHSHVTGQVRYDTTVTSDLDPVVRQFLDEGDAPLVFTLGSSAVHTAGRFYDESVGAADRLGKRALLMAGKQTMQRLGASLPSNVLMVESVPHSLVFPRAAAIVQQCGIGTLTTALASGKPILNVPFANDQPDNAWRALRLGTSRTIPPSRYRADRVASALKTLLGDHEVHRKAAEVAKTVQQEDGARVACEHIEQYLSASPSR